MKDLLNKLKRFEKVVITGPGRSGTTIAAVIIAEELGYKFANESWFASTRFDKFLQLLQIPTNMVIQAPCLSEKMHWIGAESKVAIVLMKRDINDIVESQERTLTFNEELVEGGFTSCTPEWEKFRLGKYNKTEGCIPEIVYDFWYKHQAQGILNKFELEYEDLKSHPLWINKKDRNFTRTKQINLDPNYFEKSRLAIV